MCTLVKKKSISFFFFPFSRQNISKIGAEFKVLRVKIVRAMSDIVSLWIKLNTYFRNILSVKRKKKQIAHKKNDILNFLLRHFKSKISIKTVSKLVSKTVSLKVRLSLP